VTITVVTPEHGSIEFQSAGWWETSVGNEDWLNEGHLWVSRSEDADEAIAEFARGAWLYVYEVVAPAEPRVWESIHDVPAGVTVLDKDGDEFHWDNGRLLFWDGPWGPVGSTFDQDLRPFTEKVVA
jgi:hypothetical protein